MTTITITLPEDLAKQAKAKGLLSSSALAHIIGEAVRRGEDGVSESQPGFPPALDSRLRGAVNPRAFNRGAITGDVVSPLGIAWEAGS
jgi:hypothetical protein